MGPTTASELGDAEVFDGVVAGAQVSHALGDLSTSFVECMAGVFVKAGIDGQSEKAVGFGFLGLDGEVADFDLGTVAAGPLLAGKSDPDCASELRRVGFEGLGVRAGSDEAPEFTNGCDLVGWGGFVPGVGKRVGLLLLIWHKGTSVVDQWGSGLGP